MLNWKIKEQDSKALPEIPSYLDDGVHAHFKLGQSALTMHPMRMSHNKTYITNVHFIPFIVNKAPVVGLKR